MKKKTWRYFLISILLAAMLTSCVPNLSNSAGHKEGTVNLSQEEYDKLLAVYEKYAKVEYLEKEIHREFIDEVDQEQLLDGIYHGLFRSLKDEYSIYMNAEEFTKYMEESSGTYYGIGVRIGRDDMNFIHIYDFTADDTPAKRAGLKINDQIIMVEGVEYTGDQLTEAISVMKSREKEGTVKIKVRREAKDKIEILEFDVGREEIRYIESIRSDMLNDEVGYIRIVQFDDVAGKDFKTQFKALKEKGMKSYVLDLRSNPGGLVDTAVEVADFLLGDTIVVYTEDKYGERVYRRSDGKKQEIPFVVLVNELTASSAEILSGAIQDLKVAPIVGTQTFGKGIVQKVIPMEDGSAYKYTVSKYYTPNGENIHGKGIKPDVEVTLPDDIEGIGLLYKDTDPQIQKALTLLK